MSKTLFIEAIQSIFKIASTDLIKAAVETGYLTDPYTPSQYKKLSYTIDTISQDLAKQIFGASNQVERNYWLSEA